MAAPVLLSGGRISLYAIVPEADSRALKSGRPKVDLLSVGPLAAITGKPLDEPDLAVRALAHDKIVRRAMTRCSAVVPFRLGESLPSESALALVLEQNQRSIRAMLDRFSGKVEMGLKIRLPMQASGEIAALRDLPSGLRGELSLVSGLTERPEDRREKVRCEPGRSTFEGTYLIPRTSLDAFWSAVAAVRRAEPALPMLGSGPWAPYSFCSALREETAA